MQIQRWNIVFLVGFIVYVGIRGVFERRTKGNKKLVNRVDVLEKISLILVGTGSLLLPVLYLFTPFLAFADYRLPAQIHWVGLFVMVCALWLFYRSHSDLGQNWSVTLELRKEHELVRQGVYRTVRHPMYAAIFLWDIAQGLLLENWLAGWSALATFTVLYLSRVSREEQMMCDFFGEEYREYMRRTGRLLPRLKFGSGA